MANSNIKVINFKSQPKQTFFAPEWNYYIFELNLKNVDLKKLSSFLLRKEKQILEIKSNDDGYTGVGENSTTSKHRFYNVFKWNEENIDIIKKSIFDFNNEILKYFKQPLMKEIYIKCWVNILRKNQKIKKHLHGVSPNEYLSGHFCVQCEDTSTNYINPINQINDPEIYSCKNEEGKLTLFQNNIPHFTSVNKYDKERITLAFDIKTFMPEDNNYIKLNG